MVDALWWVCVCCHAVGWQSSVSGGCAVILCSGRMAVVLWWIRGCYGPASAVARWCCSCCCVASVRTQPCGAFAALSPGGFAVVVMRWIRGHCCPVGLRSLCIGAGVVAVELPLWSPDAVCRPASSATTTESMARSTEAVQKSDRPSGGAASEAAGRLHMMLHPVEPAKDGCGLAQMSLHDLVPSACGAPGQEKW